MLLLALLLLLVLLLGLLLALLLVLGLLLGLLLVLLLALLLLLGLLLGLSGPILTAQYAEIEGRIQITSVKRFLGLIWGGPAGSILSHRCSQSEGGGHII